MCPLSEQIIKIGLTYYAAGGWEVNTSIDGVPCQESALFVVQIDFYDAFAHTVSLSTSIDRLFC